MIGHLSTHAEVTAGHLPSSAEAIKHEVANTFTPMAASSGHLKEPLFFFS